MPSRMVVYSTGRVCSEPPVEVFDCCSVSPESGPISLATRSQPRVCCRLSIRSGLRKCPSRTCIDTPANSGARTSIALPDAHLARCTIPRARLPKALDLHPDPGRQVSCLAFDPTTRTWPLCLVRVHQDRHRSRVARPRDALRIGLLHPAASAAFRSRPRARMAARACARGPGVLVQQRMTSSPRKN